MADHRDNGHLEYRDWCPDCVEGFGREWAHRAQGRAEDRLIPLVSCDYLFVLQRGVFARDEINENEHKEALKVLVLYCSSTKCMFAHAVPQKGVDPDGYVVEQIKNDILWLGHAQVAVRSDNEPALLSNIRDW